MKINPTEKEHIREAIIQAEAHTSGEIVTVIAQKSDRYLYISLFWSALLALCFPAFFLLMDWYLPIHYLLASQLMLFCLFWLIIDKTPIKFWLLPKNMGHSCAHKNACEQFIECGVHLTRHHTGIMLFVSVSEHYVEIMADKGISDIVPQEKWDTIIEHFTTHIKNNQIEAGFVEAIYACGDILKNYIPRPDDDINELQDALVEID